MCQLSLVMYFIRDGDDRDESLRDTDKAIGHRLTAGWARWPRSGHEQCMTGADTQSPTAFIYARWAF